MDGLYFCVFKCTTTTQITVSVTVSPPMPLSGGACDEFVSTWTVVALGPATAPKISASMIIMKYSRTWLELDSLGQTRQVWRFLLNGRLTFDANDPAPCPQPPCANFMGIGDPWFHGFIDYTSDPNATGGGGKEGAGGGNTNCVALSLSHFSGCLAHYNDPTFNSQSLPPGANRHDDRSFHIVAPTPFTVGTNVAGLPAGTVPAIGLTSLDAVRSSRSILAPACLTESPLVTNSTVLAFSHQDCFCIPPAPGVLPLIYHMGLQGMDACNSGNQFVSIANLPNFPPTGFAQEYLGQWGAPAGTFPEARHLWANGAIVSYVDDGCGTSVQPDGHLTHGVDTVYPPSTTTIGLFSAPGALTKMVDFCNSLVIRLGVQAPQIGNSAQSALVWQLSF